MVTATFTIPDFHRRDNAHAGRTKQWAGGVPPTLSNGLEINGDLIRSVLHQYKRGIFRDDVPCSSNFDAAGHLSSVVFGAWKTPIPM